MIVSSNTVENYLKCPTFFYLTYVERIRKIPTEGKGESLATSFGTLVHKALEIYQKENSLEKALEFIDSKSLEFKNGTHKNLNVAKILVRKEVKNLESFELLESEKAFEFKLGNHKWIGRFDLVARKNGLLFVVDYKTTGDNNFQIRPNNQVLSYFVAANEIFRKEEVGGVYIHLLKANTQDIQNYLITPNFDEVKEWKNETLYILNEMERSINLGSFAKNPRSCFNFGRSCEFLPLCQSFGRVRESLLNSMYEKSERRSLSDDLEEEVKG